MKLHFEPNLDFQLQAIEAVCDLFGGQKVCRTEFTVTRDSAEPQALLAYAKNDLGIGNRLTLLDDEILKNLKSIQLRNGLPPYALDSGDFYHVFGTERPSTWAAPIWIEAPAIAGMPPAGSCPFDPFYELLADAPGLAMALRETLAQRPSAYPPSVPATHRGRRG